MEDVDAGQRLDRFLTRHLEEWSRATIQRWIAGGDVRVGGEARKTSYRIREGDAIEIYPPPPPPSELEPEAIPLNILYEDSSLVVVNKPAGLVVHPGAGQHSGTLANALVYHFSGMSFPTSVRPGIVHRLDKDTSGVLVVAKNEKAHQAIAAQFKEREVAKTYLALVFGTLKSRSGTVEVPIGRHPTVRTRMSVRSRVSRDAETRYQVLRQYEEVSYLEVKPETGRTHQLRVHLQYLGHPVVGDLLYGGKRYENLKEAGFRKAVRMLGRHFLHASRLEFLHPETSERCRFEAPLSKELARLLKLLE